MSKWNKFGERERDNEKEVLCMKEKDLLRKNKDRDDEKWKLCKLQVEGEREMMLTFVII